MKNRKGFSLVELLAAIVIMGLLAGIAIVSINYLLDKAKKEYYKAQEDEIVMAAKSYTQDNRNMLPKRVGMKRQITLETLQKSKYIGDVVDRNKKKCDPVRSYVQVYRYDKNYYNYLVNLVCDGYTSISEDDSLVNAKPDITVSFISVGAEDKYTDSKAKVTIKDTYKISGYRYSILNGGSEVMNSGDIDGKLKEEVVFEMPLKDYVPGKITVIVVATNTYGNSASKEATVTVANKKAPTCEPLLENVVWTKEPVETQAKCIDNSGSGCQKDVYTQVFTEEALTSLIEMRDNTGNIGRCVVKTYIDRTPPTTPVINNPYENTWTNQSYKIEISSVDQTAGIAYFEYRYPDSTGLDSEGNPENEWHKWANSSKEPRDETPFVSTAFSKERAEYVEVRACDNAGNCSETAKSMIKIDKTKPSCTVARSIEKPNGLLDWYVSNLMLTINPVNNLSTASDRAVASNITFGIRGGNTPIYDNVYSKIQGDTKGVTWYGFVKDEAGNVATCDSGSFKVDATKPTCKVNLSGTMGVDNWFRSAVNISLSTSDNMSGVDVYDLSSSTSASYNGNTTGTVSNDTNKVSWYGYVKDKAGNIGQCSNSFGIDTKRPTVYPDDIDEDVTWCKGKSVSVSCADDRSGIQNGETSSASVADEVKYTCTDKAGNTSSVTKRFDVVTKACTTYNSCRHSSFGCEKYTRTYQKCELKTKVCKTDSTLICPKYSGKNKETCEQHEGCTWKQGECRGDTKECPNKSWTLNGSKCTKTVAASVSCSPGKVSSNNYGFTKYTSYDVAPPCTTPQSSFTCDSGRNGAEYNVSCKCTENKKGTGEVCGCAEWNCSE